MTGSANKLSVMSVALCATAMLAAGCTSTKQAGLLYSSTISMGLGMEVKTADTTAPLSINIGYKTLDVAYVPVAVMETNGAGKESAEKIWASHSQKNGKTAECLEALNRLTAKRVKDGVAPTTNADDLPSECDAKRDAMSVYGQFNGDASAKGNDRSAGLMVGRIFATGIAAQNVSAAAYAFAYADCAKAVIASGIAAANVDAETKRVCGRHRH